MARRVAFEVTERTVSRNGRSWKFTRDRYDGATVVRALRWNGYRWETVHSIWI